MVTSLPYFTYGQAGHVLPQFVIPFLVLSGYGLGGGGILDLMSRSLMLACLLNPMRGGWVKQPFRYLSWLFIALQCFATIGSNEGILGSYLATQIYLFSVVFFFTFISATFLGIFFAFSIPRSMRDSG